MKFHLNELKTMDCEMVKLNLANVFRCNGLSDNYIVYAAAYVIVKHSQNSNSDISTMETFINSNIIPEDVCTFITNQLAGKWDCVIRAKAEFTAEMYAAFLLFDNTALSKSKSYATTESITALSLKLLDIQPEDYVGDFCCGCGNFIVGSAAAQPDAKYFGYEINFNQKCVAEMRADVLGIDADIEASNILRINNAEFTKVFSNFPFAVRNFSVDDAENIHLHYLYSKIPGLSRKICSDWVFAASVINNLKKDGKAVVVMTPNSTISLTDRSIRKFFVENEFIESVIALPQKLFDTTAVQTILIVFSLGNSEISFVDAHDVYTAGRRKNILSDENVDTIVDALKSDTKISKKMTVKEIAENDFELNPMRYFADIPELENAVLLSRVINSICRGLQIKADELDKLASDEDNGLYYVALNDIQDGIISKVLTNIKEVKPQHEKYCVTDKAFILSRTGPVFKMSYLEVNPGEKVLIGGNMYIINLDYGKINPYFLKAFLESETGQAIIKHQCSGSALPIISSDGIKKIMIPLPDMDKQNEIADIYCNKLEELRTLKERIVKVNDERTKVYENYSK